MRHPVCLSLVVLVLAGCGGTPDRAAGPEFLPPAWMHLSTAFGDLAVPNPGNQQTATAVFDVDQDGISEFLIAERTEAPAVVGYRLRGDRWERFLVEPEALRIEAGSAFADIDGDGDLDVVFGGDAGSSQVWWWENPYPDLGPDRPWKRRVIKDSGGTKHHDQLFADTDGDGVPELAFWNQSERVLLLAEIPVQTHLAERWDFRKIYEYDGSQEPPQRGTYPGWKGVNEHEGLTAYDMNGDGILDLAGGGRWFERQADGSFAVHVIDDGYAFSRVAVGQLDPGGWPEVVLVAGDGRAPLMLYGREGETWQGRALIPEVQDGHSLQIIDFDRDGILDIFCAEMQLGQNPEPKAWLLRGLGDLRFEPVVLLQGFGLHESVLADLDGDGDLDLLGKPYTWQAPRLDIWLNPGLTR